MALILNIETATEVCSVALGLDGQVVQCETIDTPNRHASHTTVLIQQVLDSSGYSISRIDAVAVSSGPGSYTGLRIGASTAKGICFARRIPLIAIPTLQGIAQGALYDFPEADLILPMIDARRQEVYAAHYDNELLCIQAAQSWILAAGEADRLLADYPVIVACGNGAEKASKILENQAVHYHPLPASASFLVPSAEKAWQNKDFEDISSFNPLYLKPPNITTPKTL